MSGWLLWVAAASAWETDPLTARAALVEDSTAAANRYADTLIDAAIAQVNTERGCGLDVEAQREAIAAAIFRETADRMRVAARPGLRGEGHGVYSGWLESSTEVSRRNFDDRSDLFGGIGFGRAPILAAAGTCSLVRIGGVLVGTDKPDHFWYSGYQYYVVARRHGEQRAVEYGTHTENAYYGLLTSSTFSYADLHANWQGYQFYRGLLEPGSEVVRTAVGCLARGAAFDWARWADWRWDEAFNPNYYAAPVQRWIDRVLDDRSGEICADVAPELTQMRERASQSFSEPSPWAGGKAPRRYDPYGLQERCDAAVAEGTR